MKGVICSIVVVLSVFVYGFAMAASNNPPSAPVTVVNGASNPVPVSAPSPLPIAGTINISGTSDVNVTNSTLDVNVQNTPSVNVANTPSVTVTNPSIPVTGTINANQNGSWTVGLSPSANTVKVENTVANPVLVQDVNGTIKEPFAWDGSTGTYTVPATKRLVIESSTFYAFSTTDPSLIAPYIEVETNGKVVRHFLHITRYDYIAGGSVQWVYTGGQAMRLYADPGSTVTYGKILAGSFPTAKFSISGYLEQIL